jgi:hypothetical protein
LNSGLGTVPDATGNQFFGPNLDHFVLQNNATVKGTFPSNYQLDSGFIASQDENGTPYGFTAVASPTTTPSGLGTNRSKQTMNGYFAAMGQSFLPSSGLLTPYAITNATGQPQDMFLKTDPFTNTLVAVFNFANVTPENLPTDVLSGMTSFGGIGFGRSAYVDDQHMAALNGRDPAYIGNINGNTGIGNKLGDQLDGFRSFFISHDVVGTSGLLPAGVELCQCQYLQWGYWDSNFRWDDPNGPNMNRNESFHIGTWVAGDLTKVNEVQGLTGTATFNGHVVANVFDGSNQYLAAGAFQDLWNFSARNGTVSITNLDGHNYASATGGITSSAAALNNFGGPIAATDNSGIQGKLNGSFFNAPNFPAAYQAGSLFAQGPANYRIVGTFASQRPKPAE